MSVETLKIKNMLLTSANKIISNVENLTKLDCELGDGDHGTTMEKIAKALMTEVDAWNEETDLKEALEALNDTLEARRLLCLAPLSVEWPTQRIPDRIPNPSLRPSFLAPTKNSSIHPVQNPAENL